MTELAEIVEVDSEVDSEEAHALSDRMDEKVRSCLCQHCKSKQHPEHFALFPKGWKARGRAHEGQRTFQRGGAELSGLSGPGTSERVFLATQTSRVNTLEVVLGSIQVLFLPEDHPLLNTVNRAFGSFGVQGRITASSDGPTLYHLELMVSVDTIKGDALVSSLMSDCSRSLILEEVVDSVVLPSDL